MKRKPRIRKSSTKKLFTELHMPKNILKSKYISTKLSKNRSPSVFEKVS